MSKQSVKRAVWRQIDRASSVRGLLPEWVGVVVIFLVIILATVLK